MTLTQTIEAIPELAVGSEVFEEYLEYYKRFRASYDDYCEQLLLQNTMSGWTAIESAVPGIQPIASR